MNYRMQVFLALAGVYAATVILMWVVVGEFQLAIVLTTIGYGLVYVIGKELTK